MRKVIPLLVVLIFLAAPIFGDEKPAEWVSVQPGDVTASGAVVYTGSFKLDFPVTEAYLKFTCYTPPDCGGTRYRGLINFIECSSGSYWPDAQYVNVTKVLHQGTNEIDIEVAWSGNGVPGPVLAKLIAKGIDKDKKPVSITFRSDSTWTYTTGAFDLKHKAALDLPPKKVVVLGPADTWELAKNPSVLPEIDTGDVVGISNVGLTTGTVGGADQYNVVKDYGDKFDLMRSLGLSAVEDSIRSRFNYQVPGQWFWGYDKAIAHSLEIAGFDLSVSPDISAPPDWYVKKQSPPMARLVGQSTDTQSLSPWSPLYSQLSDNVYSDLKLNIGESVHSITPHVFGDPPVDFLAGDDLAKADFQGRMLKKYGSLDAINAAWHTSFKSNDEIAYPKLDGTSIHRWTLDFVNWYYDSMTDLASRICSIAKTQFPSVPITLPLTCNNENPAAGQDCSALPRALGKLGAGVRAPSGSILQLRRISSACKFYGTRIEAQVASVSDKNEALKQLFMQASSGCSGLFTAPDAIFKQADIFDLYRRNLRGEHSITEIAVFFPTSWYRSDPRQGYPPKLAEVAEELRDVLDYDVVDENMIADGALDKYRVLALFEGDFTEQAIGERIVKWVENGGTLILRQAQLPFANVDGDPLLEYDTTQQSAPGGAVREVGKGQIIVWDGAWGDRQDYYSLIYDSAYPNSSDGASHALDGKSDGVWSSMFKNMALYLNTTGAPVRISEDISEDFAQRAGLDCPPKNLKYSIDIPAHAIVAHFLDKPFVEFALECEGMSGAKKLPPAVVFRGGCGNPGGAVRAAAGTTISAEFLAPYSATYAFACIAEPVGDGTANLDVDGKNVGRIKGSKSNFLYPMIARLQLSKGKHSISLHVNDGTFIADKVMVTTDTDLAGFAYGYTDPQADQTW